MSSKRKLDRATTKLGPEALASPLRQAIELETMLAPTDYVQIHQALHFTLGFAERRKGNEVDGVAVTQKDCDALAATIVKVELVLETALKMKRAADDALVAKPDPKPLIYSGAGKQLVIPGKDRENEILKFRGTEQNQGEIR